MNRYTSHKNKFWTEPAIGQTWRRRNSGDLAKISHVFKDGRVVYNCEDTKLNHMKFEIFAEKFIYVAEHE